MTIHFFYSYGGRSPCTGIDLTVDVEKGGRHQHSSFVIDGNGNAIYITRSRKFNFPKFKNEWKPVVVD